MTDVLIGIKTSGLVYTLYSYVELYETQNLGSIFIWSMAFG